LTAGQTVNEFLRVCVCVHVHVFSHVSGCVNFFFAQGLGRLYHSDYSAAHDSEYKEDIDYLLSIHTHTLKESLHHSSFKH